MSFYRQYTGDTIGRVCHFLNVYGDVRIAETVTVSKDTVYFFGKKLATFSMLPEMEVEGVDGWKFKSKQIPIFVFEPEFSYLSEKQGKLQRAAILEAAIYEVEALIKDLEYELHGPLLTKNMLADYPDNPKYKNACIEFDDIRARIDLERGRLAIAKQHEFDYTLI
jgi:hypothetical protein